MDVLRINYQWPNTMIIKAVKEVKRHGKGASGGVGGRFAKKEQEETGIKEVDNAKSIYGEYNRARVKVAKLQRAFDDNDGKVPYSLRKELRLKTQERDKLSSILREAKIDALVAGYDIDSRGNVKGKIDNSKDSPFNDLLAHIKSEKELSGKAVASKKIGTGGTFDNPNEKEQTADAPFLEKLENGKFVVRKLDGGPNGESHASTEVAASRLSALLGIGNVPVTAQHKNENGELISSQEFVQDTVTAGIEKAPIIARIKKEIPGIDDFKAIQMADVEYNKRYNDQLVEIYVLDRLLGGVDRHEGNVIQKDGTLYAIDNGRGMAGLSKRERNGWELNTDDLNKRIGGMMETFFGFPKGESQLSIPKDTIDRWKSVEKKDLKIAIDSIIGTNFTEDDFNATWNDFAKIRDSGIVGFEA